MSEEGGGGKCDRGCVRGMRLLTLGVVSVQRKWEAWVMIASLVDRLKASEREGKRFRKKGNRKVKKGSRGREQRNEDGKRGQSKIHVVIAYGV